MRPLIKERVLLWGVKFNLFSISHLPYVIIEILLEY